MRSETPTDAQVPIGAIDAVPAPRKAGRPNGIERRIDLVQLYKLRVSNGLSYRELAEHFGIAKSSVHAALQRLNRFVSDPQQVRAFEEVEPTVLTAAKQRLLASLLDEEAIQKASLNNRAFAFSQVANHERLVKGESTHNIGLITKLVQESDETLFKDHSQSR